MTRAEARSFIDKAVDQQPHQVDREKLRQAVAILAPGLHTSDRESIRYATLAINLARDTGVNLALFPGDEDEPQPNTIAGASAPESTPSPSVGFAFPTPAEARFDTGSFTTAGAEPGQVTAGAQPPPADPDLEKRFRAAATDAGMTAAQIEAELQNFRNQTQDPAFAQQAAVFFGARIDDLIAQAPEGTQPTPIGVPADFVAFQPGANDDLMTTATYGGEVDLETRRHRTVEPRYFDGDEFSPAGLDPGQIAETQERLMQAGLLEPGEYWSGMWDALTISAYRTALGLSNASGRTIEETIDHMIATLPDDVKEARARAEAAKTFQAPPFLRPDKATLAQRVKDAVRAELGRDPTPEDLAWGVSGLGDAYRQEYESQVAAARAQFDAEMAGTPGGGTVQAVDPLARFRETFESRFAPEIDRLAALPDVRDNMNNVFSSLRTMSSLIG